MATIHELEKTIDASFNEGEILNIEGFPRWITHIGPHKLILDIVTAGKSENGELGIASFVVMEQEQTLLLYTAEMITQDIVKHLSEYKPVLLITAESKGSHFAPWVWNQLARLIDNQRLISRIITLRKGEPKVYMNRPVVVDGKEVNGSVEYHSITSKNPQLLTISPKDGDLLSKATEVGAETIIVDDFLGKGGTIVGINHLFENIGLCAPKIVAAIGSDGELYKETFYQEGYDITVLPKPLLLRLPTFLRSTPESPWRIYV